MDEIKEKVEQENENENLSELEELDADNNVLVDDKSSQAKWYVVHTYSGYENKVKDKIQMMIENEQENIFDVMVPMEKYTDKNKKGEKVFKERKLLPGYVLIKMIITPQSWYLIRNTNGVTGFVGPGSDPIPLTKQEIIKFGVDGSGLIEEEVLYKKGDKIELLFGPYKGFIAEIEDVYPEKKVVRAMIDMFGRSISAELSFDKIQKIS